MAEHFSGVGKGLDKAVEAYNRAAASLESRVLVSARRFADYGAGTSREIPQVDQVEKDTRRLQIPDGDEKDKD
jgi:DNA recombination protein RmuC